ncbi:MAG: GntR family transcriptional regulator [Anaerovoracaceae bacterium]
MITPLSADQIYKDLLKRIIALDIEPGAKVSENSLGTEYNVSRSVMRNIFARLNQIGFVEILPQRGTYITQIDLKYISAVLLMRLSIEKEMLQRFVNRDDNDELIELLKENVKKQQNYVTEGTYIDDFRRLDESFHGIILERGGLFNIDKLLHEPLLHLSRWRNVAVNNGFRLSQIVKEHQDILESIEKKDIDKIDVIITNHIENTIRDRDSIKKQYRKYCINI